MSRIGVIVLSVFLSTQFFVGLCRTISNGDQQRSSMNITCEEDELVYICTIETAHRTDSHAKPRIYFVGDVRNITHARFVESEINTLTKELLAGFPYATTLEFAEQQINTIERGAFATATQLQMLVLSSNNISHLESDVFSGLSELRNLSLENNQISQLPRGVFAFNAKLGTVSVKGNQLTSIDNNIFSGVSGRMDFVDFSDNSISHFDLNQFSKINAIDVSSNRLTEVKIPTTGLERLKASNNRINRIVPNGENKQLKELNLAYNKLTNISWLLLFPAVNILDLSGNEIEEVRSSHFSPQMQLTELSLINNRLVRFDVMSAPLRNLIVLDLSGNRLKSVDISNPVFSTLEVLYLSRNRIVTVTLPANNSLWQFSVDDNEMNCSNLRTHLPLLAKVVVRITDSLPCKVGYIVESDFCCKEN